MAIYVPYVLVRQDDVEVEYAFGPSFAELDRRLLVHRLTLDVLVRDGAEDHAVRALVARVVRERERTGSWPEIGQIAS